jgi:hypothetical protein
VVVGDVLEGVGDGLDEVGLFDGSHWDCDSPLLLDTSILRGKVPTGAYDAVPS